MATGRIILHLDLDCFYCQVEQKRLGIPREVPAAVQQWDGLIAINYAARALGVTRHMRVLQAMQKCPELQCLHVQTLGGETGQDGLDGPVNSGSTHPNDRLLQKACLERYRKASAEIIAVIRQLVPQAILEKASIDEVYVDVTPLVEKELMEREDAAVSEHAVIDAFAWGSIVEGGPLDTESELDRRLSVGASISCRIRGAIRDKLDFTSSVGIAHNKLLAKVGSARNKPDQQTIVTSRGISSLMEDLPLKKLRNFGGKLGAELQALGATTAGQVAAMPFQQLQQHFGERAGFISDCVRGIQDEPVKVRELSKSMLAAKSFEATADLTALNRWLGILADELSERIATDSQINQRAARLLVLGYRQRGSPAGKSKSIAMPRAPAPGPSSALLQQAAFEMLQKCPDALPCNNLGLTATEFQELPGDEQGCITKFFQPKLNERAPDAGESKAQRKRHSAPVKPSRAPRNTINSLFKKAGAPTSKKQPEQVTANASIQPVEGRVDTMAESRASDGALIVPDPSERARQGRSHPAAQRDCQDRRIDQPVDDAETCSSPEGASDAAPGDQHKTERRHADQDATTSNAAPSTIEQFSTDHRKGDDPAGRSNGGFDSREETSNDLAQQADPRYKESQGIDQTRQAAETCAQPSGSVASGQEENSSREKPHELHDSPPAGSIAQARDCNSDQGQREDAAIREAVDVDDGQDQGIEADFQGVDMAEQKRILHEIWMRKNMRAKDKSPKRTARKSQSALSGIAKQPRLTDMYFKRT